MSEAIRHPKRGKAHRPVMSANDRPASDQVETTACDRWVPAESKNLTERLPLANIDPADWCRRCWPTTTEGGPRG